MKLIKLFILTLFFTNLLASEIKLSKEEQAWIKQNPNVKVLVAPDFEPFSFNGKGLDYDLLYLISNKTGLNFEFIEENWSKSLISFKNKKAHIIVNISKTKERESFVLFTKPYYEVSTMLFVREGFEQYNGINSLKGKKVGILKDVYYSKKIKALEGIEIVEVSYYDELVKLLAIGKIDAVIADLTSTSMSIQKNAYTNIRLIEELSFIKKNDLRFGIQKDETILHGIMIKALASVTEEEKFELEKKWIGKYLLGKESSKIQSNEKLLNLTKKEKEFLKSHPTITLGSDYNWLPYIIKKEDGTVSGYDADILNEVNKITGANFKLVTGIWKNILIDAKTRKIDGLSTSAVHEEREKYFNFSDVYVTTRRLLIVSKLNPQNIYGVEDLENKKIGYQKNNLFEKKLVSTFKNTQAVAFDTYDDMIKAIIKEEIDVIVGSYTLMYFAQKKGFPFIKIVDTIEGSDLNLVFSLRKDYPEALSILNKGLKSIPSDTKIKIHSKWFFGKSDFSSSEEVSKKDNLIFTQKEKDYLQSKDKIKICVLPNWLPFEQIDEDNQHKGIGADILKNLSNKINKEFVLVPTKQWADSLQNIRDRKCDILPVAMDIPSRRDAMDFTEPYVKEPFVIATTNDKFYIRDVNDLSNKKVGIVKSYAFIEVLKAQNPLIDIVEVANSKEGLEMVLSGELFGYVDTMPTIGYFIQKHGLFDLKIAGKLSSTINLSIASRNDEPILNEILQKALNTISEEEIRAIVGNWIKIKVQQEFDYSKLFYIVISFGIILLIILYKNRSINSLNKELIKEQKTIESLVQFQESLLSLFDKGDSVLFKWSINNKSKLEFISQSVYNLTLYSDEEFLSRKIDYTHCIHENDLQGVISRNKEALKNKEKHFKHEPYRIIAKDGTEKWVLDYRIVEKNKDEGLYVLGYISDITDHIKQQERISHQSKMISLGEMIGNIAHQWRQPLSLISSIATGSVLQRDMGVLTDKEFKENMELINSNVQYLSKTIDDFRDFVRGESNLVRFNLSDKIDDFLNLVNPSVVGNQIKVIKKCEPSIEVETYPNDLIQSLINIYNNSKDALKEVSYEDKYFFIDVSKEEKFIKISIKDNGGGIKEEILDKIFEPYTTTKHQSQGTGLGMNITYKFIVSGMNGEISAFNTSFNYKGKDYEGAQIIISLPLYE